MSDAVARSNRVEHAAAPAALGAPHALPHALHASLGPDEVVILLLRPSLLYIPLSSLGTLVAAAIIGLALAYLSHFPWIGWSEKHAVFIGATIATLRLGWAAIDWWFHLYALTDRRILARYGVFRTALYEAPLSRIQNTIVVQSLRERIFALGTIGFATAGRGTFDAFWVTLGSPFAVHRTVLDAIERYGRR
jgi:membrane protein YdbS with pleckstrin-like domain